MPSLKKTSKVYGFLWQDVKNRNPSLISHFKAMQQVLPDPIIRGAIGLEVGCGSGYDTYVMAKDNPRVIFTSIDLSEGIFSAQKLTKGLQNVRLIKGSALDIPCKNGMFDFVYSFGVLHHTPDPESALTEISRVLKSDSPAYIYVYEDHADNPLKQLAIKCTGFMRRITVKLPSRFLYALAYFFSPLAYLLFSLPAKVLRKLAFASRFSDALPFNFGRGFFSLRGDLYDRFHAPIEKRFNKKEILGIFYRCGFRDVEVTKMHATAGWVVWGYKR